jgi:hypothetical protein
MQTTMQERLSAMRREILRRNEEWARVKEEFASRASQRLIPLNVELFRELDRTCDVTVPCRSTTQIQNAVIRA